MSRGFMDAILQPPADTGYESLWLCRLQLTAVIHYRSPLTVVYMLAELQRHNCRMSSSHLLSHVYMKARNTFNSISNFSATLSYLTHVGVRGQPTLTLNFRRPNRAPVTIARKAKHPKSLLTSIRTSNCSATRHFRQII